MVIIIPQKKRSRHEHWLDTFDALSANYLPVAGSLAVDTGALKAATQGDWGKNLVTNGEFTTDTAGWTAVNGAVLTRRDYATSPSIAPTGGANNYGLEIASAGTAFALAYQALSVITGARYVASCRGYSPSANAGANLARLDLSGAVVGGMPTAAEDAWQSLSVSGIATSAALNSRLMCNSTTAGDMAHFDAASVRRQNAAAILSWSPTFRVRLVHIPPALGTTVTPAGWMFRYTDNLNYWEARIVPNTAGNDLLIVQVTAGAETVRSEARIAWTTDHNDELYLDVRGQNIVTAYRKYGSSVWATGPSYASATQGLNSPWMGPLLYGTEKRLAEAELWA